MYGSLRSADFLELLVHGPLFSCSFELCAMVVWTWIFHPDANFRPNKKCSGFCCHSRSFTKLTHEQTYTHQANRIEHNSPFICVSLRCVAQWILIYKTCKWYPSDKDNKRLSTENNSRESNKIFLLPKLHWLAHCKWMIERRREKKQRCGKIIYH